MVRSRGIGTAYSVDGTFKMKRKKSSYTSDKDFIYEIKSRLKEVVQEPQLTRGLVGFGGESKPFVYLWQPHDFRRYFDFSRVNFNVKKPSNHAFKKLKTMVPTLEDRYAVSMVNHGSEALIRNFMFCTLRIKKNQVEVTNNFHKKQWRKISADSLEEVNIRIDEVMQELRDMSLEALKVFINLHGGKSEFKVLRERCEHGIHGIDFLDRIPREMVINDTVFKKVYDKKVEFKDVGSLKNCIANMSLKNVVPEILSRLGELEANFVGKAVIIEKQVSILALAQTNTQNQLKQLIRLFRPIKGKDIKRERPYYCG